MGRFLLNRFLHQNASNIHDISVENQPKRCASAKVLSLLWMRRTLQSSRFYWKPYAQSTVLKSMRSRQHKMNEKQVAQDERLSCLYLTLGSGLVFRLRCLIGLVLVLSGPSIFDAFSLHDLDFSLLLILSERPSLLKQQVPSRRNQTCSALQRRMRAGVRKRAQIFVLCSWLSLSWEYLSTCSGIPR